MLRTAFRLALLLVALVAFSTQSQRSAPAEARRTSAPRLSDAELEKAIRARFARSKIAANNFTVRVQGGVATLEGRTGIVQHKATATRLAKAAGAKRVINKIEVSEEARRKASANLAQGRRRAQIKRSQAARSEPR